MKQRSFKLFPQQIYNGLLLVILLFLANRRAFVCWYVLTPDYYCEYGNEAADYILWGMVLVCALLLAIQRRKLHEYWLAWKRNWPLGLFLLYSVASISWSIVVDRSIHTTYIMVAASLTGALLPILYSPRQLMKTLLSFTLISGLLSLVLVILFPGVGIHQEAWLAPAWHGIFTHKNYLGSLMALGNGLVLISIAGSTLRRDLFINGLWYLFTLFMIVMSRSATGLILWVVLNGLGLLFFAWQKWHRRLQRLKLSQVAGLFTSAIVLALAIFLAIVQLTGRNLNLTGRVPLWSVLIKYVVSRKPWLGYGLETLWYFSAFQIWAGRAAGWSIVAVNGHSGYMDILVYLGVVGLALFLVVLARGFIQTAGRALSSRTWIDFFPLLAMVYILVVNITISYFIEFESFHWVVLVMLLFLPLGKLEEQTAT